MCKRGMNWGKGRGKVSGVRREGGEERAGPERERQEGRERQSKIFAWSGLVIGA